MKKFYFIFVSTIFPYLLLSQESTFYKHFGGEGEDIGTGVEIIDSQMFIVGTSSSFNNGGSNIVFYKIDEGGNIVWSKSTGSQLRNLCNNITQIENDFLIFGQTIEDINSPFIDDLFLQRIDTNGNLVFEKFYGNSDGPNDEHAGGVFVNENDEILFTGYNLFGSPGDTSINHGYIAKLNSDGEYLWSFAYDTIPTTPEQIRTISAVPTGYIATGGRETLGADYPMPIFQLKIDEDGILEWWKHYNFEDLGIPFHSTSIGLSDGTSLIIGRVFSSQTLSDILLLKTDAEGDVVWAKTIEGNGWDEINGVIEDPSGSCILCGQTDSYNNSTDGFIIKLTPEGDIVWSKTYGGDKTDIFNDIKQAENGNLIIVGASNSYHDSFDNEILVVRTNSEGEFVDEMCFANQNPLPIVNQTATISEGGHFTDWEESTNNDFSTEDLSALNIFDKECNPTNSFENFENDTYIRVYPNPVINELNLEFGDISENEIQISMSDLTGDLVFAGRYYSPKNEQISTKNLKAGMYLIKLYAEGQYHVIKIVKTSH